MHHLMELQGMCFLKLFEDVYECSIYITKCCPIKLEILFPSGLEFIEAAV